MTSPLLRTDWEPVSPLPHGGAFIVPAAGGAEGCLVLGHMSGREGTGFKPGSSLCLGVASGCSPALLCSHGVQDSQAACLRRLRWSPSHLQGVCVWGCCTFRSVGHPALTQSSCSLLALRLLLSEDKEPPGLEGCGGPGCWLRLQPTPESSGLRVWLGSDQGHLGQQSCLFWVFSGIGTS